MEHFNEALEKDLVYARAWRNKGWALIHLGKKEEGGKCIRKALQLDYEESKKWLETEFDLEQLERKEIEPIIAEFEN